MAYFIAAYITKQRFTVLTKNGGGDHKRRLSRVHYICTMHCVQCTLEKQCTAHHVIMQYKAVRWWWGINTNALWCDENTIGTNRNLHEPLRTCAIQYDNTIVAHRIATYWVAADRRRIPVRMYNESMRMYSDEIRTNRNWHELIRRSAMQYDAIRIGSIRRANTNVLNISKHSYWPAN